MEVEKSFGKGFPLHQETPENKIHGCHIQGTKMNEENQNASVTVVGTGENSIQRKACPSQADSE